MIAANGVNLRTGPSDNYDPVELFPLLPQNTKLDVLRTILGNDDWIKVRVNVDSSDQPVVGYVPVGYIKINKDLADIPPIFEFGPHLVDPKPYEQRPADYFITFKWENKSLHPGQFYSVILYRTDQGPGDACFHYQYEEARSSIETQTDVTPSEYGCLTGEYYWGVGIATPVLGEDGKPLLGPDGKPVWRDDSEFDERNIIGLGVPPRDRPKDTKSGGGSDGGGTVLPGE